MGNANYAVMNVQRHLQGAGKAVNTNGPYMERDRVVAGMLLVGGGDGEDDVIEGRSRSRLHTLPPVELGQRRLQHLAQILFLEAGMKQVPAWEEQIGHAGNYNAGGGMQKCLLTTEKGVKILKLHKHDWVHLRYNVAIDR
jgi:hypothetical protein